MILFVLAAQTTLYITVVDIMCISLSFFRNFVIQSISVCKKERRNGMEGRKKREGERKRKRERGKT